MVIPDRIEQSSTTTGVVMIVVSVPQKNSEPLARGIVARHLGACVQVLSGVTSYFHWDHAVRCEPEHLLLIKTAQSAVPALKEYVASAHPYEVPEFLVFNAEDGLQSYLAWIQETAVP